MRCYTADENGIVQIPRTARIAGYAAVGPAAPTVAAPKLPTSAAPAAPAPAPLRLLKAPTVAAPLPKPQASSGASNKPSAKDVFSTRGDNAELRSTKPSEMTVEGSVSRGPSGGGGGGSADVATAPAEPLQAAVNAAAGAIGGLSTPMLVGGLAGAAILLMFLFGGDS